MMKISALLLGSLCLSSLVRGQQKSFCNPIDIDYRYNFEQVNEGISYRSGADPVILVHKGQYYLFETIGNGYWRSPDLARWIHVDPDKWPFEEIVAPAALSVRDTVYLLMSTFWQRPILMSTDPASGHLEFYNRLLPPLPGFRPESLPGSNATAGAWDPGLFHDDDTDRWFLYWGSSNVYPIWGVELDKAKRLAYKGDRTELLRLHPKEHGWERFGRDHRDTTIAPFVEGAWMTKHGGKYYLQYGAPGTEFNAYANGTYVGDGPLGPFTYAPYNPVAYKPGGFMQGAGHGNTFQDLYGNWWNTGTPWVALNWNFERRIGMHPAGFDADGAMWANTRFGDFPHWAPTKKWASRDESFTGWMLLSYRKPARASSARTPGGANPVVQSAAPAWKRDSAMVDRTPFAPANVTDENPRTFWLASTTAPSEWIEIDLGKPFDVKAVQVNYADYQSGLFATDSTVYTRFRLAASVDGTSWRTIADLSDETHDRPNAYIELARPVEARYVRYEHGHVGAANLAISDIRVFGNGRGRVPEAPKRFTARRVADARNAFVTWQPVRGAVGYNVRWGIARDKLYQTYQVFADGPPSLEVRALNVGQDYWFAIEAFDENGVSTLTTPVAVGQPVAGSR